MSKLLTLCTGSSGNSYVLTDDDGNSLILDAGVKADVIKKALKFDFSSVNGVLITHSHKDHSLSADILESYGLDVWHPYKIEGGRDKRIFGKWAVSSFDVPHGDCPCCGFYIRHIDGFKMLYVTDLELCRYRFASQKVNFILCECNWDKRYVIVDAENYRHKVLDHMSLDACKGFLKANKTEGLKTVMICHQSNQTLDVVDAVEQIKRELGIDRVYAAIPGEEVEL